MASFDDGSDGSNPPFNNLMMLDNLFSRDWLGECWKSYEYVDETPPAVTESNFFYLNVRRKSDNGMPSYTFHASN